VNDRNRFLLHWLVTKQHHIGQRFDLSAMEAVCKIFHNPQNSLPTIHVAGTNGKGSVCTKIAKAFELAGYTVGLFTSPHISSCTERFQLCGNNISYEELFDLLSSVYDHTQSLSFFEITTILALLWFTQKKADIIVLEAGIGGRLDATNICCPILSIITSISLDHTEYLGSTLESITSEKAGIIKENIPVVIGPRVPHHIIQQKACITNSPVAIVNGSWQDYDEENSAIASSALQLLFPSYPKITPFILQSLSIRPICRFQPVPPSMLSSFHISIPVILDVAHNPDGIHHLIAKAGHHRFVFLFAVSCDKEVHSMIQAMKPVARTVICTQSLSSKAMAAETLCMHMEQHGINSLAIPDIEKAVSTALHIAQQLNIGLLITGTFYLMNSVRKAFGYHECSDIDILEELEKTT
jgi:dihydrofolate synthase/folylpolyglutamate synthase